MAGSAACCRHVLLCAHQLAKCSRCSTGRQQRAEGVCFLLPARGKLLSPTGQMHAPLNGPVTTRTADHPLLPARRLAEKFPQDPRISPYGPVTTVAIAASRGSARPHKARQRNAAGAQGPSPRVMWRCLCRCWPRQPSPPPRGRSPHHRSCSSRRCQWCRSQWSSDAAACAAQSTARARPA